MATLYKHTGEVVDVQPANGKAFTMPELYNMLDCAMIQILRGFRGRQILIMDEEGKSVAGWRGRINRHATQLTIEDKIGLLPSDVIVGHALLCKRGELK